MLEMCAFVVTKSNSPNKPWCPTCFLGLHYVGHCCGSPRADESYTSVTVSHKLSKLSPSIRRPASDEIILASVLLCEPAVCFLHDHEIGTNTWLPNMHNTLLDVDLQSARSPAESVSRTCLDLHLLGFVSNTTILCTVPVWCKKQISFANRLSHALFHFVTDLAK